ncbi:hypothetical protein KKD60_04990, partial [Patescibacteria group bacterium]|nr:hypothetical protein [Patescibacteria group bacterium]
VIISAAASGRESIEFYLREQNLLLDNVHIVSNGFKWDEQGKAIDIEKPVIHTVNKNEAVLHEYYFYDQIKERKNVLLFGDALEDVFMVEGLEHDNILKIGFLNKKIEENRDKFLEAYDAVVVGDGDFSEITKIHL